MATYNINFEHNGVQYSIPVDYSGLQGGGKKDSAETKMLIEAAKFKIDNGRAPSFEEARGLVDRWDRAHELITKWFGLGDKEMINALQKMNDSDWTKYNIPKEGLIVAQEKMNELGIDNIEDYISSKENETQLNPYAQYMETQRAREETAQLGLLNQQTDAARQNADISAQQNMIQQQTFKDQLIEQIKNDRLSKLRSGLTPMQIANESMQFMVGNMQANNQQIQQANQQRLAITQQQQLNPYQAYINANQAATGGQGYANLATGLGATDAGSPTAQLQEYMRLYGGTLEEAKRAILPNQN